MKTTLLSLIITGIAYVTAQSASISSASSSKCLDVKGSKFKDGTVVDMLVELDLKCRTSIVTEFSIQSCLRQLHRPNMGDFFGIDGNQNR